MIAYEQAVVVTVAEKKHTRNDGCACDNITKPFLSISQSSAAEHVTDVVKIGCSH